MTVSIHGIVKTFTPLREVEFKESDRVEDEGGRIDRTIDAIVRVSANAYTFVVIQALLITWALLGIPYSKQPLWPIVISDAQAIVSYIFDTLLMRQLLKYRQSSLRFVALMRHHNQAKLEALAALKNVQLRDVDLNDTMAQEDDLVMGNAARRSLDRLAQCTGHLFSVSVFVAAVLLWVGFGPSTGFSSQWQLDMNSASSAWMVFLFSLLAVVHEHHSDAARKWTEETGRIDVQIKDRLRLLSSKEHQRQDDNVYLPVAKFGWWQDIILFYAHIVGGFIGVIILVVVFIVWLGLGPLLKFDDSWWLAIGTYSGLIGLFDSFVLRNVQMVVGREMDDQLGEIQAQDEQVDALLHLQKVETIRIQPTLTQRISKSLCRLSADQMTVFGGLLVCVGLLVGASALRWSLTGQLLCNVPPSILESFLMQILITGHLDNAKRQTKTLQSLSASRTRLLNALNKIVKASYGVDRRQG
jgi:low-affinity ferrous iron transport protein